MQAILIEQFGDPDAMRLRDVPDPVPGRGEVLLRVHAAGINPVDAYRRSGRYANLPALPYTPGSDAAGVVEQVGEGVSRWRPGDRVYSDHTASGACAERMICREDQLHPLPDTVSFEQGAALGVPYATAFRALFQRGGAKVGERLLIHGGTGGVGLAAIQFAHAAGLEITATGGSEEGRRLAAAQGAAHLLDHSAPDHAERLREAAGSRGFDLILEMLANVNLPVDLTVLAPRGRVVVIGSRGTVEIDPRQILSRDADVRGMTLFRTPDDDREQIHASIHSGLQQRTLRPLIAATLPLAQAPEAHRRVIEGGHAGKIILLP